jgi:hypothetical protein
VAPAAAREREVIGLRMLVESRAPTVTTEDDVEDALDPIARILLIGIFGRPEDRGGATTLRLSRDLCEIDSFRQVRSNAEDDIWPQRGDNIRCAADVCCNDVLFADELDPTVLD